MIIAIATATAIMTMTTRVRMVRAYETGIALALFAIGMGVRAWSGSEAAAIVWKLALIASYLVAGWRVLWAQSKT